MSENNELRYRAVLIDVYNAARIIGNRAAEGAEPWEIVRGLAMMIDDLDRAIGKRFAGVSTALWCASDNLRAEAQAQAQAQAQAWRVPPEQEGEP